MSRFLGKTVIGVTGGIGSGKSAVLDYLEKNYRVKIIGADETAHLLMQPGYPVYEAETALFGEEILSAGLIDRKKLAKLIYSDASLRRKVNEIVHPAVKEEIIRDIGEAVEELVFVEAALLIEAGYTDICDMVWYIYADEKSRMERLVKNRGYSLEYAGNIMKDQLSDTEFEKHSTHKIDNSGDFKNTAARIDEIMGALMGGKYGGQY